MIAEEIQSRIREIFRTEATELVAELEAALLELEPVPTDTGIIGRVFRALHTLKGSGATSGYPELSAFLHRVEDVFFAAREGRIAISSPIIDQSLKIADAIHRHLAASPAEAPAVLEQAQPVLDALLRALPENGTHTPAPARKVGSAAHEAPPIPSNTFAIRFVPRTHLFETGTDPGILLDDLRALGDCTIEADTEALPTLDEMAPEACYFAWRARLLTSASAAAMRDVFMFVEDDCDLEIKPVDAAGTSLPVEDGAARPASVPPVASPTTEPPPASPTSGAALSQPRPAASDSLRVSADKLDRLVNMVGELVILRSQVSNACATMADVPSQLQSASEGLERLTKELRDVVLEVRMMPIGETFNKFKRLTRDLSRDLGKVVELEIEGSDTELDKTVLEQLRDPLVHLVRNCLDHGLESPDERVAAGKPPQGTLRLRARQNGEHVWVTVSDDGRGLDPERIRQKGIERGLVSPDAVLTSEEIYQLVFLPGFSTADKISQVSGRGVGLDVVKRQLEALRGTVELHSECGRGTTIRLSVPLTLAIIEGLLVRIEDDNYVLPLAIAEETIELRRKQREQSNGRNVVHLRGEWVPYLRLRELFHYDTPAPEIERVVIVSCEDKRLGLVVDEVVGNHQTVLKPLGWLARHVRVFSGATVLGDGRIGLICDIPAIVGHFGQTRGQSIGFEV